MNKKQLIIVLLMGFGLILNPIKGNSISVIAKPHKFYTSITQMEYNVGTKSVEVIMNVFADDLEKALTAFQHQPVKIEDKQSEPLIAAYLKQHFYIRNKKGQLLDCKLIGIEPKSDMASIYVEIKAPAGLKDCVLMQNILTELFPDQVNIVNFTQQGKKQTYIFKADSKEQRL